MQRPVPRGAPERSLAQRLTVSPPARHRGPQSPLQVQLTKALLGLRPLDNAFHRKRLSPEVLEAMEVRLLRAK